MLSPRDCKTKTADLCLLVVLALFGAALSMLTSGAASYLFWCAWCAYAGWTWLTESYIEYEQRLSEEVYQKKLRRERDNGNEFHQHPSGWYYGCDAADLARGKMRTIRLAGREILLFRGEDGTARAMHPFCPHKGADLSGGRVTGNCVECPFHGWKINGVGDIEDIPYCRTMPKTTPKQPTYPCQERFGCVFVWYDREDRAPFYEMPDESEHPLPKGHRYVGRVVWEMACPEWEIHDNSADFAHFTYIHASGDLLGHQEWCDYSWNRVGEHKARGEITSKITFGNWTMGHAVTWVNYWLGMILTYGRSKGGWYDVYMLDFTRPVDYHRMERFIIVYLPWYIPKLVCWFILRRFFTITTQDGAIWSTKISPKRPFIVKEEKEMIEFVRYRNDIIKK